uniref:Interferon alpha n=1 Tax=Strigops habroptila TaxID=2489341 RepID=A0A672TGY5_STRHB
MKGKLQHHIKLPPSSTPNTTPTHTTTKPDQAPAQHHSQPHHGCTHNPTASPAAQHPPALLLLTALTMALTCHHLRPCDAIFSWNSLQLFQVIAPSLPQLCCHQQAPFPFPDTLLHTNHPQQATAATTLHILQHLFTTLRSHSTPHHWNAQARHHLINDLQCYIHRLEQCMPANGMLFKGQRLHNLLLRINKHFGRTQHFLCAHHHRPCTWDHVCLKAHICFQCVDTLAQQMKRNCPLTTSCSFTLQPPLRNFS